MKLEPPNPAPTDTSSKSRTFLVTIVWALFAVMIATVIAWGFLWTRGHDQAEKTLDPATAPSSLRP